MTDWKARAETAERQLEEANRANVEIEEAYDAAAKARDEAGFLGSVEECIRYLDAELRVSQSQLEEAREALRWRPIETAPRDEGTDILASSNGRVWFQCSWAEDEECFVTFNRYLESDFRTMVDRKWTPTVWMPLPVLSSQALAPLRGGGGEPTEDQINRAAWAWRNDKDRETDGSDDAYFRSNWRSLPGLKSYVDAVVEHPIPTKGEDHD